MKRFSIYFLTLFALYSYAQQPRVPSEKDGNFLLFKNDSVIITYYWDMDPFADEGEMDIYYKYFLEICVKNLTKDTINFKFNFSTFELKPKKLSAIHEENLKYAFSRPLSANCNVFEANCRDIVDFTFQEFILKFKSGKTINVTKQINTNKHKSEKELIKFD